jgi:peptidoglycan/LPS O-acetylase OafA/YrhL
MKSFTGVYRTSMSLPRNIDNIQILRAIAALMVLLLHINSKEEQYAGSVGLLSASFDIGHTGVDLFFLISGFVMVYTTRLPEKRNPRIYIRTRFIRIYPIYWLVMVVTLLLYLLLGIVFPDQTDGFILFFDMLLIPTGKLPVLNVAWTLIHEVYFYLVFAISLFFARSRLVWFLIVWLFLLTVGTSMGMNAVHPAFDLVFHPLTVEFIVGACIGVLIIQGARNWGRMTLWCGMIWLLFIALYRFYTNAPPFPSNWLRVLLSMPPLGLILYGSVVLELLSGRPKQQGVIRRILRQIGDASYGLYLVHLPVLVVIGEVWTTLVTSEIWHTVILISLWFFGSILFALFIHRRVEQPLLLLLKEKITPILVGKGQAH